MIYFFAILFTWLILQITYKTIVHLREWRWETHQKRNNENILIDSVSFDKGNAHANTAILFIHGFVDTPHFFYRAINYLEQTNTFFCRAIRIPGWGKAPRFGGKREIANIDIWENTIINEILNLRAAFPNVCVIAHSLGAAITISALKKLEQNGLPAVKSLVLLAPLFKVSNKRSPLLPPHIWHKIIRITFPLIQEIESPLPAARMNESNEVIYHADKFVHREILDNLFQLIQKNKIEPLPKEIPTLLVLAENDYIVDNYATILKLKTWTNKKVLPVECEHQILMRAYWKTVTLAIQRFLNTNN